MPSTIQRTFLLLAVFQALHSFEEYVSRLWEHLAPARFVSGLISDDLSFGFAVINLTIVALVFWSYLGPVRNAGSGARPLVWFWAVLETLNGAGHILFGISSGGYFSGLYTAPFLLSVGAYLLVQLNRTPEAA